VNNRTVLYVEDEENDVVLIQHVWEKAGIPSALKIATDGEQAVAYLAGDGRHAERDEYPMPCLVLLDLNLPKLGGLEVLKWIREQPHFFTLRVVVLSSSNRPRDIHTAYACGANAYLVKPPSVKGLVEMVSSVKEFWLSFAQTPPECSRFKGELLEAHR
jgi:CheY-like chemotaxis protein